MSKVTFRPWMEDQFRNDFAGLCKSLGWKKPALLTTNTKTLKTEHLNIIIKALQLQPATQGGGRTRCTWSGQCEHTCLAFSGMGVFENVWNARMMRTIYYLLDTSRFMDDLCKEIARERTKSIKKKYQLGIRLDTLSDIPWYQYPVFHEFPDVQFYDYTKGLAKLKKSLDIPNWHLTYSYNENTTAKEMEFCYEHGINIAVVFAKGVPIPDRMFGRKVINGDERDDRWNDPPEVVVALQEKRVPKAARAEQRQAAQRLGRSFFWGDKI